MLPTITIEGRLVADPDLRFTPSGKGVANIRVAANDSRKLDDGTWENTEQIFVSVPIWNSDRQPNLAETIAETLRKGDKVIATGRIYQREYESNGEKRTSLEMKFGVVAKVVDPPRGQAAPAQQPTGSAPAQAPAADPWGTPPQLGDEPPF